MRINAFLHILRVVHVKHRRIAKFRLEGVCNSDRFVNRSTCTSPEP